MLLIAITGLVGQVTSQLPAEFKGWESFKPAWPIRYQQWQTVAPLCRFPVLSYSEAPHGRKWALTKSNPIGEQALAAESNRTFPVGSVLVKEKYTEPLGGKPILFTGMVKRAPGFDPKVGDWEFFVVNLGKKLSVYRGQDSGCVKCHQMVKDYGYVFSVAGKKPRVWMP